MQAVVAVGVGSVGRSSVLFTTILRQARRHLLPEKLTMQSVAKKSSGSKAISKKIIAQVDIIVIVALDGNSLTGQKIDHDLRQNSLLQTNHAA